MKVDFLDRITIDEIEELYENEILLTGYGCGCGSSKGVNTDYCYGIDNSGIIYTTCTSGKQGSFTTRSGVNGCTTTCNAVGLCDWFYGC